MSLRFTLAAAMALGFAAPAFSQVISLNVVGYYLRPLSPGDNLIANQLLAFDNSLNTVLSNSLPALPDGATFTKWSPATGQLLPLSTYNAATEAWSINYTLTGGEGGILHTPAGGTNIFVGGVDSTIINVDTGAYNWHPNYANGYYLISAPVPFSSASFQQVVGRDPLDGEWVKILNEGDQTYSVTTFHSGSGWDNGVPSLGLGQAAWFDLGPVDVPEPGTASLLVFTALGLWLRGRKR